MGLYMVSLMHTRTHNGDQGILLLQMVFLQHRREGFVQHLAGLHHDPGRLTGEDNLQPETQTERLPSHTWLSAEISAEKKSSLVFTQGPSPLNW